jgi:two-component system response regulator
MQARHSPACVTYSLLCPNDIMDSVVKEESRGLDVKACFGSAVKSRRTRLGFSQEELAWRSGLHRTYVADIERGARNPSLESIQKLARALEVSLAAFFEYVDQPGLSAPYHKTESAVIRNNRIGNILLVEDTQADVELTLKAFKKARLSNRVHVVADGAEALDFLFCRGAYASLKAKDQPQLVLLDLHLPKIDGLEVLRRLKNDERTRTIPVVVLTVSQQSRDVREARRLGAEAYIVKPVDFHNFSDITPQLRLAWALVQFSRETKAGEES